MASSLLDSYLISVGFQTDLSSLRQLQGILNQAQSTVTGTVGRMGASVLGVQTAIVGAFSAIGAAVIGLGVKAAQQDQNYRLMSNRMMTTKAAAETLSQTLDILGVTFADLQWDKELQERAAGIETVITRLRKVKGASWDESMRSIRELTDQFGVLGKVLEYGSWRLASDIFEKLGINIDQVKAQMREFIMLAVQDIPEISQMISARLIPILEEGWDVLKNWGTSLVRVGDAFSNLINIVSGDKAIDEQTSRWERWGAALGHVADLLAFIANTISKAVSIIADSTDALGSRAPLILANALGLPVNPWETPLSAEEKQKWAKVEQDFYSPADLTAKDYRQALQDSLQGTNLNSAELDALIEALVPKRSLGRDVTGTISQLNQALGGSAIDRIAAAVAMQESGNSQVYKSGPRKGQVQLGDLTEHGRAIGVMQLLPGTAAALGVDPYNEAANRSGGRKLLSQLFDRYHDWRLALEAYSGDQTFVGVNESKVSPKQRLYAQEVLGRAGMTMNFNVTINGGSKADVSKQAHYTLDKALDQAPWATYAQGGVQH